MGYGPPPGWGLAKPPPRPPRGAGVACAGRARALPTAIAPPPPSRVADSTSSPPFCPDWLWDCQVRTRSLKRRPFSFAKA
eukprot:5520252-Pleurochrysis_carterae.AAC.3